MGWSVRDLGKYGVIGIVVVALTMGACVGPSGQPQATTARSTPGAPVKAGPSRVVVGIEAEIDNLSTKLGGGTNAAEYNFLSNSPLVLLDPQGRPSPWLAAERPSQENGSWVVNPDGTMRTTWKIRPNARWHDGQPVSPRDFVFALRVYLDETMPIRDRSPEPFMDRVEPVDAHTFVIHWKQTYPWADELIARDLEPLPEHILGSLYIPGDPNPFLNHPFWSSPDYVGTGPYRLVRWDPGTQLIYRAFDDFFMGRPNIDEVVFRIIPDSNTFVANLLGGEVDASVGSSFGALAAATVKERWGETGEGKVVGTPVRWRHTQIQFNREYLGQPALLDRRVRRAIVHGIDRETLAQTVSVGLSGVAEIYLTPADPLYEQAQRVITKYPYDPNRALTLLQEAGWTRSGDRLGNAAGERFTLDIRTTQGTDSESEASIMAADLTRLGMEMSLTVTPSSRVRDREYRVKFPGLNTTALSIQTPGTMRNGLTSDCPLPERRYEGGNRGCWTNAEFDRLFVVASTSLDPRERGNAVVEALRIWTEDVGVFGLSYVTENIAVRKGLIGPGPRWPAQIGTTWNIHEWRWER